ncbi:MAG: hypothetical protein ACXIUW_06470 [Roseinatronobacter sp.]
MSVDTGLSGQAAPRLPRRCFGLRTPSAAESLVDGSRVEISSPRDAIAPGISLVPENRKEQGLVLQMNCRDNMTLPQVQDLTSGPFMLQRAELQIFDQYRDLLAIKTSSWRQPAGVLTGGNQQKDRHR